MAEIQPSDHGIVVDHKDTDVRYAVSDHNFNPKVHRKVRDLKPGESVQGYRPKLSETVEAGQGGTSAPAAPTKSEGGVSEALSESTGSSRKATQTEGAATAASQEKEGK